MSGYSNEIFARQLRSFRAARDVSQEQLAKLCGLSTASIQKYEDGSTSPTLANACALATALECTPDDLCDFKRS